MFKYESQEVIDKMSATEFATYKANEKAHEAELQKEAIKEALKPVNESLEKANKAAETAKKSAEDAHETIKQLQERNDNASVKDFDVMGAIEDGLKTLLPTIKAKSAESGRNGFEVELTVKAPINMATTAVTNGTATPVSYVAQGITAYAEDVRAAEYINQFLSVGSTARATIDYVDKSPTEGTMSITQEGALKPLISVSYVIRYSQARKMAGRTKISEEAIDDLPFVMSAIRNELMYQHSMGIQGDIFTTVSAFAPAFVAGSLAASTATPSNYDAIRAAIYAVKLASKGRYIPNAVLVPSGDVYAMGATKATDGQYVFPPFVMPDGTSISGVRIVEIADGVSVPAGTFIVGDWKKLHLENYKTFTVRIGQGIVGSATAASIVSDFESNMYTLIGESRYHLWIYENEKTAFLKTTFAAVKTAIATVVTP